MISFSSLTLAALTLCIVGIHAQQPKDENVTVGQQICTAGYIMDEYCINRGTLLDASSVSTLENPELHSVHCLIDVGLCNGSPFHILTDPRPDNAPNAYGPGWAVSSNDMLMDLGKQVGSCSDCDDSGTIRNGLRMEVRGTVVSLEPAVIDIEEVQALLGDEQGCPEFAFSTADANTNATGTPGSGSSTTGATTPSGAIRLRVFSSAVAMIAVVSLV